MAVSRCCIGMVHEQHEEQQEEQEEQKEQKDSEAWADDDCCTRLLLLLLLLYDPDRAAVVAMARDGDKGKREGKVQQVGARSLGPPGGYGISIDLRLLTSGIHLPPLSPFSQRAPAIRMRFCTHATRISYPFPPTTRLQTYKSPCLPFVFLLAVVRLKTRLVFE